MSPRFLASNVIRPPENLRRIGRLPKSFPIAESGPKITNLSDDSSTAIGMDSGNLVEISTLLTKPTEKESVEKPDLEIEPPDYAGTDEIEENVLFLLAGGGVLHGVPLIEERYGSVVGSDKVEAGVDGIGGGPWISVEVICAYLKIFRFILAQLSKWVPQPHYIRVLFINNYNNMRSLIQKYFHL